MWYRNVIFIVKRDRFMEVQVVIRARTGTPIRILDGRCRQAAIGTIQACARHGNNRMEAAQAIAPPRQRKTISF